MTRPQPRYKPGDRIGGRYQVHQVKMGGMGEVYLCLDLETNYPYALKTFQQRYQSTALWKAFEQEVATWVALEKHPNIVRCFHMDILDNRPFMVLEWIAGEEGKGADLRGWLRRGPLELRTTLDIVIDVVRGLLHAQEKQPGIVHRDLKPENILVAQGPVAKITDFGLARIVQAAGLEISEDSGERARRQSLLGQGGLVGTPAYMAPEQWRGEAVDERTDIYAVGCIMYEMLTGQWPFQVHFSPTTPQQFQQWLSRMKHEHETGLVPTLPSSLPTELSELMETCLSKTRTDRSANPLILLEDLTTLYQQQFEQSPPLYPQTATFTVTDYNNRGNTYRNLKQYKLALADYDRAISLATTNALIYANRGIIYADLQQYEAALADFGRAITIDPTYSKAYANRGTTYADLHQYEVALADFGQAIELAPNDANTYANRGKTYHALQQFEAALADFDQAIKLDPNNAAAYASRGITYHRLQRYEESLTDFEQAIELDPNFAQVYYNRGVAYADLQRYKETLADYNRAIELDPNYVSAYYNRGTIYQVLQQYEEALADFGRAITIVPTDIQAYYNRGIVNANLHRYDEAIADFKRVIELDPNLADAYINLGALLGNQGRHSDALLYFEKAVELGDPQGLQYVAMARQELEMASLAPLNPAQAALEAFQQAESEGAMWQATIRFPFMVQADFIAAIEQAIAQQVLPEHRPYIEQRLGWLRQIAEEQNQ